MTGTRTWTLAEFDALPDGPAVRAALHDCCTSPAWSDALVRGRPYRDADALLAASDAAIAALDDAELDRALAGHPRIGDRTANGWSQREQAGMAGADEQVRRELAAANADYERHFGRVYLVRAAGRSAAELLALCRERLGNDPVTEGQVVRRELAAITRLRLAALLGLR